MLAVFIIALTWKRSLKRHLTIRSLDWIKPDEDRIKLYLCIALLNLGIAVLLLLFAGLLSPANEIMILLLTPLYVLPVYFLSLNNQEIQEFFKPLNRTSLGSISLAIIILNASFFLKFEASLFILVYQLFVISLVIVWLFFARHLKEKYYFFRILKRLQVTRRFFKTVSLRTAYSLAFTSLCFILGIIPVFQFHRHAFNLERIKNAMAIQYNMLKETSEKPKNSRRVYLMTGMEANSCQKQDHSSPQNFRDFENLTKFVSPVINNTGIGFIKKGRSFLYLCSRPALVLVDRSPGAPLFRAGLHNRCKNILPQVGAAKLSVTEDPRLDRGHSRHYSTLCYLTLSHRAYFYF